MNEDIQAIFLGNFFNEEYYGGYDGAVFDIEGICPALLSNHYKYVLLEEDNKDE